MRFYRRLLHHRNVVEEAHVRHTPARMARIELGAQKGKLLACRFGRCFAAHQIAVSAAQPLLTSGGSEFLRHDAHGNARRAAIAGRPVGNHLTAAKSRMGERFIERLGEGTVEAGEDLSLGPSREVWARASRSEKELRYARCS